MFSRNSEPRCAGQILTTARGLSPELKGWCIQEGNRQLREGQVPEVGLDIVMRSIRPVAHVLLDTVS
jgi:hypothetical protein